MTNKKTKDQRVCDKPYVIPSRPESLITMVELMQKKDPCSDQIADILKKDVYLYASVLAAVNAPHVGLGKKITDLSHAITLLGLDKLFAIVRLAALKNSLGKVERLDRFWDSATEVAELSAKLAKKVSGLDPHMAYTLGMMHDCGIPLMLESFESYKAFLREVNGNDLLSVQEAEIDRYSVNHFKLGAEVAQHWFMPEEVCQAIEHQAGYLDALNDKTDCSDDAKMLVCVLILAKNISSIYRRFWRIYDSNDELSELKPVLSYLGVPDVDYLDLREDFVGAMEQKDLDAC